MVKITRRVVHLQIHLRRCARNDWSFVPTLPCRSHGAYVEVRRLLAKIGELDYYHHHHHHPLRSFRAAWLVVIGMALDDVKDN
jgi:hypothetical protein